MPRTKCTNLRALQWFQAGAVWFSVLHKFQVVVCATPCTTSGSKFCFLGKLFAMSIGQKRTLCTCSCAQCLHVCPQYRSKQRNFFLKDNEVALNNIDAVYQGETFMTKQLLWYFLHRLLLTQLYSCICSLSVQGQKEETLSKQWNSWANQEIWSSLQGIYISTHLTLVVLLWRIQFQRVLNWD